MFGARTASSNSEESSIFEPTALEIMTESWAIKNGHMLVQVEEEMWSTLHGYTLRFVGAPICGLVALLAFVLIQFTNTQWNVKYLAVISIICIFTAIILWIVGWKMQKNSPLGDQLEKDLAEFEDHFEVVIHRSDLGQIVSDMHITLLTLYAAGINHTRTKSEDEHWNAFHAALAAAEKFFVIKMGVLVLKN